MIDVEFLKNILSRNKGIKKEIKALNTAIGKAKTEFKLCDETEVEKYIQKLYEKEKEKKDYCEKLFAKINKIEDSILRTLLIERFINDRTWEAVSMKIDYDYYHIVKRLYPKAVLKLAEQWEDVN